MKEKENLCLECPVRGKCCYLSISLGDFNIILDFQPCTHLDTNTGLCKDYEKSYNVSWCNHGTNIFNKGALPEGCLYLKKYPNKDQKRKPKVNIRDVIHKLNRKQIMEYNFLNNQQKLWEVYLNDNTIL
jgi:uncharacterized cysteine cluster protein YcgN (CxxCxxCC family)